MTERMRRIPETMTCRRIFYGYVTQIRRRCWLISQCKRSDVQLSTKSVVAKSRMYESGLKKVENISKMTRNYMSRITRVTSKSHSSHSRQFPQILVMTDMQARSRILQVAHGDRRSESDTVFFFLNPNLYLAHVPTDTEAVTGTWWYYSLILYSKHARAARSLLNVGWGL